TASWPRCRDARRCRCPVRTDETRWLWRCGSSRKSSAHSRRSRGCRVPRVREVMIVAGEASGDLHAAGLAESLRRLRPDLDLVGVGGGGMERAGVHLVERIDGMAVMGFVE